MHRYWNIELAYMNLFYRKASWSGTATRELFRFQFSSDETYPYSYHMRMSASSFERTRIFRRDIRVQRTIRTRENKRSHTVRSHKRRRGEYSTYCRTCMCVWIQRFVYLTRGWIASLLCTMCAVSVRSWLSAPLGQSTLVSAAENSRPHLCGHVARQNCICSLFFLSDFCLFSSS